MAKCIVCMNVKGKRKCRAFSGMVCSSCCGTSRTEAACAGCSFFKSTAKVRRYDKVPCFSTQQMADSEKLQDVGNVIEGAMCGFDVEHKLNLNDEFYKHVLERLLDRYAFGDEAPVFSTDLEREGFAFIESAMNEDLAGAAPEYLGKLISTVYRSIKRHSGGDYEGRDYIGFIQNHVGIRVTTGLRALSKLGDRFE